MPMSSACRRPVAGALLLALSACAAHVAAGIPMPANDLAALATGRTLRIVSQQAAEHGAPALPCDESAAACATARVATIYLSPTGRGWIDEQSRPSLPPRPGTMGMIIAWRIEPPSRLCITSSPLIGDMPSGAPMRHDCITIEKSPGANKLVAKVAGDSGRWTGYVSVQNGNVFPPGAIAEYIEMVKALYGHHIPDWGAS